MFEFQGRRIVKNKNGEYVELAEDSVRYGE
jgi:hypothetical protein